MVKNVIFLNYDIRVTFNKDIYKNITEHPTGVQKTLTTSILTARINKTIKITKMAYQGAINYRRALDELIQSGDLSLERVAEFKANHSIPPNYIMRGWFTVYPSIGRLRQISTDLTMVIDQLLSLEDDQSAELWALLHKEILWLCRHLQYMRDFADRWDRFKKFEELTKAVRDEIDRPKRRADPLAKGTIQQNGDDLHTDINVSEWRNLPRLTQDRNGLSFGGYCDVHLRRILTSYALPIDIMINQPLTTVMSVTLTKNGDSTINLPLGLRDSPVRVDPLVPVKRASFSMFQRS